MTVSGDLAQQTHVVVLAKAPQPGQVKTRLMPVLGAIGAAALARTMLHHTLHQALAAKLGSVSLCMSPDPQSAAWHGVELPSAVQRCAQGSGDLGERMARAAEWSLRAHTGGVLLIGTDCPALTTVHLQEAALALRTHDAALLGAHDGGYVLLGLKAPCPTLFTDMPWSTDAVARLTLQRLAALGARTWLGPVLNDIDEPQDLQYLPPDWQKILAKTGSIPCR